VKTVDPVLLKNKSNLHVAKNMSLNWQRTIPPAEVQKHIWIFTLNLLCYFKIMIICYDCSHV